MRLSDVMSSLQLSVYPQIALVIFLLVFGGVCLSLLGKKERFARSAALPLDEDTEGVSHSPGGQQS
jgi:cbb3-type cytochrome oxidase subunit 3